MILQKKEIILKLCHLHVPSSNQTYSINVKRYNWKTIMMRKPVTRNTKSFFYVPRSKAKLTFVCHILTCF